MCVRLTERLYNTFDVFKELPLQFNLEKREVVDVKKLEK